MRNLIRKEFGVLYSLRHVPRILRGFGMSYAKPYLFDYRKPSNADALLAESIEHAVKDLPADMVVGFMDEAAPQTTDNRQRFWSFGKPNTRRNTTRIRANTFGFYPINGKEVVDFEPRSQAQNVCGFLRKVRDRNPGRHILVFLDNFMAHKAAATGKFAESLGITLLFLPKYSPDLDPIEFVWKSVRRRISQISFIRNEWSFKESIRTAFHRLVKSRSFMSAWLEKFQPCFSNLLCQ